MKDYEIIYEQWHTYASTRDVDKLIELYSPFAVLESPLIPIILNTKSGILHGKEQIYEFLLEGTKRRPNELVRWHRTGDYFFNNNTLVWEYPRETPDGDQIDILELMKLDNQKILYHRIYWGWFGTQLLIENQIKNK